MVQSSPVHENRANSYPFQSNSSVLRHVSAFERGVREELALRRCFCGLELPRLYPLLRERTEADQNHLQHPLKSLQRIFVFPVLFAYDTTLEPEPFALRLVVIIPIVRVWVSHALVPR